MRKSRYMRISKHEKFLTKLLSYVNDQITEFRSLQNDLEFATFEEVFQTLESIKKKIEKFREED